ncbi:MAG: recombination protein O N-terminal domain-containing protein [Clostridia bacterium]|nr:recombination protein O N-terminal domain-containing protein [Clostridia bacterium]
MQHFSTDSLILRAVDRGDNDKLITVLTADYGRFFKGFVINYKSMSQRT